MYDVASDTWSDIPNMKTARHHSAGAASQGKIFVSGGMTGTGGLRSTQVDAFLSTVEVYDIASGTWSETWPMQFSRAMHSMVAIDNRLVAMGGQGALVQRRRAQSNTPSPPEAPQARSAPMPLTQWGTSLPAGGCAQTPWVPGCARVVEGTEALSSVEFLDLRNMAGCPVAELLPGCGWNVSAMSTPRIGLAAVYAPQVQAVEPAPSGVSDGYVSPLACILPLLVD